MAKRDPKELRKFVEEWRKKWDTQKVPGCKNENCGNCSYHKAEKVSCPLQIKALRKELGTD